MSFDQQKKVFTATIVIAFALFLFTCICWNTYARGEIQFWQTLANFWADIDGKRYAHSNSEL